ncbi:MAG: helix-turn-helix transcriptional regulator [Clostridia bacterium]|nr:helix-turn-helix transcriptional regulator [Clostridia bacterium]
MYFNDSNEKIIYVGNREAAHRLSCTLAGVTYPNPEYRMLRYPSKDYIFEYVISGAGYLEYDRGDEVVTERVDAGTFYFIGRGAEITYYADPDDPYEKIWINLDGDIAERLADFFSLGKVFTAHGNVLDLFLAVHDRLSHATDANLSEIKADVSCLLFEILTRVNRDVLFPDRVEKNTLDEKIRAYIDANVYAELSLDIIAEHFGITKMHVIRVFRQKFGSTPMQYLAQRKIGIAQSLLTGTVMPIKEIAALLRYSNTQHFSTSFKTSVGCTPNQFRQSQNNA